MTEQPATRAGGVGRFAAVDLGASSGRVMAATVSADAIELIEVHRFRNRPVAVRGTLYWDILALYRASLAGLTAGRRRVGDLNSIGIDSWAVDYGLLDGDGVLLGNPVHYRDGRTGGAAERVLASVPAAELYGSTGIQLLPFNTIFQLVAAKQSQAFSGARRLLLVPDLIGYWLTGAVGAEATNASTTQLMDIATGDWAWDLIEKLGLPHELLPPIHHPGTVLGRLNSELASAHGLNPDVRLVAVGSHDTASAVVGVPASRPDFAYISCGTWSLVGLELDSPVLSEASRLANFSNEGGVDNTIRYLRNIMGLWLLQESLRAWEADGEPADLASLLRQASSEPPLRSLIDPDDPSFLAPGDMPSRIRDYCRHSSQPIPESRPALVRCIVESLALAYRRCVRQAAELADRDVGVIHLVGGGAQNGLLCQLAADACGLPVIAGPVEAAALGNILIQARAIGVLAGSLTELRSLLGHTQRLVRYEPRIADDLWASAERRVYEAGSSGPHWAERKAVQR